MKRFIFPSVTAVYFTVVLLMTKIEFKKTDLNFIMNGFTEIPDGITGGMFLIIGLFIISAIIYLIADRMGGGAE